MPPDAQLLMQVRSKGIIVFVPQYGIEGQAKLPDSMSPATLTFNEEKQVVNSQTGSVVFTIFDALQVRATVEEGSGHRRNLELTVIDPSQ